MQVALAVAVTAAGLFLANALGWTNSKVYLLDFACFTPPERCARLLHCVRNLQHASAANKLHNKAK